MSEPLRVLLVVGLVAGGAGRHVHSLAQGLAADGHAVRVMCPPQVSESYRFDELPIEIEFVEIAERPHPGTDARTMRRLTKAARDADVVHAHGVRAGAMAVIASKRTPVVVTLHNAGPARGSSRVIFQALERVIASRASIVLGVSDDLVDRMRQLGASGAERVMIPAPMVHTQTAAEVAALRTQLGSPQVLVLAVGRLAEQKRVDLLIDAASHAHESTPSLRWFVAGDGPLQAELSARIRKLDAPVELLGQRRDVPALLAAADLVVSSAQWEGQPVWLQEALQTGCAIVATDVGGTAAVVGDSAVLVPFGDARELGQAVIRVATDTAYRQALKVRARARARELPTEQGALAQIEEIYLRVIHSDDDLD